ncbi:glycoside hydrolase family 43 protein [Chryseolinea sp. T2]|uniref:glycoside hydrolase family 43 protein n=1 Tax=Chryseolinea sp. T2 TaxID=3129255 RepID=UPI00307864E6
MKQSKVILLSAVSCLLATVAAAQSTFTNPLLPSGPDPWNIYVDGYYYYTNTLGNRVDIWKTKDLSQLKTAERKTIWTPPPNTMYSKQLWAPEIHHLNGKWYAYFAADDGNNDHHRMYVLENSSSDPMTGTWNFKGKVADQDDKWAIDGSVFEHHGKLYFIWSGWEGDKNGRQDIYIAEMENPWTIRGRRVRISKPELDWERHGDLNNPNDPPHVDVNEGPQFLKHGKNVFIVYSASACWTDFYALGMLQADKSADLLDPSSWKKSEKPVFNQSTANGVFAPGHNSFFKSPDGQEDWILYHANDESGQGCGNKRSPRAQKFTWMNDLPVFGEPLKAGVPLPAPSKAP